MSGYPSNAHQQALIQSNYDAIFYNSFDKDHNETLSEQFDGVLKFPLNSATGGYCWPQGFQEDNLYEDSDGPIFWDQKTN